MTDSKKVVKFRGLPVIEYIEHSAKGARTLKMFGDFVYGSLIQAADGCFIFQEGISAAFQEPAYHQVGMGCGLEDRGINDRYEAMEHGFDCGVRKCQELYPEMVEVDLVTVGQFTGLMDKNRKEIYEGDIVKDGWNENNISVVDFSYGSFNLGIGSIECMSIQADDCEVIGNIYEHPELLQSRAGA